MKINDVKAMDYRTDGDLLTIPFADTSVEAVLALDAAVLSVKTDAGDTVEVLAGYALKTATVAAADPTSVTAVYTRAVDGTAAALDTISCPAGTGRTGEQAAQGAGQRRDRSAVFL